MICTPGYLPFQYEYNEMKMHPADLSLYKFVMLHKDSRASDSLLMDSSQSYDKFVQKSKT